MAYERQQPPSGKPENEWLYPPGENEKVQIVRGEKLFGGGEINQQKAEALLKETEEAGRVVYDATQGRIEQEARDPGLDDVAHTEMVRLAKKSSGLWKKFSGAMEAVGRTLKSLVRKERKEPSNEVSEGIPDEIRTRFENLPNLEPKQVLQLLKEIRVLKEKPEAQMYLDEKNIEQAKQADEKLYNILQMEGAVIGFMQEKLEREGYSKKDIEKITKEGKRFEDTSKLEPDPAEKKRIQDFAPISGARTTLRLLNSGLKNEIIKLNGLLTLQESIRSGKATSKGELVPEELDHDIQRSKTEIRSLMQDIVKMAEMGNRNANAYLKKYDMPVFDSVAKINTYDETELVNTEYDLKKEVLKHTDEILRASKNGDEVGVARAQEARKKAQKEHDQFVLMRYIKEKDTAIKQSVQELSKLPKSIRADINRPPEDDTKQAHAA